VGTVGSGTRRGGAVLSTTTTWPCHMLSHKIKKFVQNNEKSIHNKIKITQK
jgi:hypothetical protein